VQRTIGPAPASHVPACEIHNPTCGWRKKDRPVLSGRGDAGECGGGHVCGKKHRRNVDLAFKKLQQNQPPTRGGRWQT
jgi:hypothetical protein